MIFFFIQEIFTRVQNIYNNYLRERKKALFFNRRFDGFFFEFNLLYTLQFIYFLLFIGKRKKKETFVTIPHYCLGRKNKKKINRIYIRLATNFVRAINIFFFYLFSLSLHIVVIRRMHFLFIPPLPS